MELKKNCNHHWIGEGNWARIATVFRREGANVVVNGLTVDFCNDTVREVIEAGDKAIPFAADVSKAADQNTMVVFAIIVPETPIRPHT